MPGKGLLLCLSCAVMASAAPAASNVKLPLEFEANQGQFAPEVLYLARTSSHFVYLTRAGLAIGANADTQRGGALQMKLVNGAGTASITPEDRLQGVSNYFLGNNPARWQHAVPHFSRVRYRSVWPGIDLVVHGRDQSLEYDFEVAPGADASRIHMAYDNAGSLRLDGDGNLAIRTRSGEVVQHLPEIYQEAGGVRQPVRGGFRVAGNRDVRFEVGGYDRKRKLVIDPTVTYATYIGASGTSNASAAAVDGAGNFYVGGTVTSPDFPTASPIQQVSGNVGLFRSTDQGTTWGNVNSSLGPADVLALAVDPSTPGNAFAGTSHGLYKTTTYGNSWSLSNTGMKAAPVMALSIDPLTPKTMYACQSDSAYTSTDGGATWTTYFTAGCTAIAADFKTEGTVWLGSTYGYPIVNISGKFYNTFQQVVTNAIALDPTSSLNIFYGTVDLGLARSTNGGVNFTSIFTGLAPTSGSSVTVNAIAIDKRNPARVLVGTDTGVYLSLSAGSSFQATSGLGTRKVLSVAIDPNADSLALAGTAGGGVYRSTDGGQTWTSTGPANLDVPALAMSTDEQTTYAGLYAGTDAFVTKINAAGTAIVYSTYLGGSGTTNGYGLGVDSAGHAFLCGSTTATDFPVQNAYQQRFAGSTDVFVSRLSASGSSLDASTFMGGRADDTCNDLAVDSSGNVHAVGSTTLAVVGASNDFPTTAGAYGKQGFGGQDCIVFKFDNSLQTLIYSTFLGGNSADDCYHVAADSAGNTYAAGATFSGNFPVTRGALGPAGVGGSPTLTPTFVTKIKADGSSLIYAVLIGGTKGATQPEAIAVDKAGRVYLSGYTFTPDYPVTGNALNKTAPSTGAKGFLSVMEADASKLVYSTFTPDAGNDAALGMAIDANGVAWLTGEDLSDLLPLTADALPVKPRSSGTTMPFLVAIDTSTSTLTHATYLGGSSGGIGNGVALGSDGSVFVVGSTLSTDFTVTGTPFQKPLTADSTIYLMRLVFPTSGTGTGTGTGTGGTTPTITSVQNGASFQDGFPINSWMTIKGTNLSSVTDTWSNSIVNGVLPTKLDDVTVTVNGQSAYVDYVSATQINVVAPTVTAGPASVVVKNLLGTSTAFTSTAQTYQPAFFLAGTQVVASHYPDYSYAATAHAGDVLILWGTGFGPTTPAAPTGVQVPASQGYTVANVTVTINGVAAQVYGTALSSGFAALYQVAIQVPATLTPGTYPLVATVGGASSPTTATITIQ